MSDEQEYDNPHSGWAFSEKHRCSACWGYLLVIRPVREVKRWVVRCENCGERTPGFVTKKWTERRAEASSAELREAKQALRAAVPWLATPQKSQSEILAELGISV